MKKRFFLIPVSLLAIATCGVAVISCNKPGSYGISAATKVDGTNIEVDKTTLGDSDSVNVTLTNTRASTIVDANLSIIIGSNHTNVALGGGLTTEGLTLTYTKQQIQEKFGGYTIKNNDQIKFLLVRSGAYEVKEHILYKIDDFGESLKVTSNDDWAKVEKKFLVKDFSSNDFILHENFGSFIVNAPALPSGDSYTIYLLYGEYFSANYSRSSEAKFNISGVVAPTNETIKLASIRAYKTIAEGLVPGYGISASNCYFNLSYLNILGNQGLRDKVNENNISRGIMCDKGLNFDHCDFKGTYTHWYVKSNFTSCTFDSRYTWDISDKYRNNPGIWLYSNCHAVFDDCDFYSGGKCIKIDSGPGYTFVVKNCRFFLDQSKLPDVEGKKPDIDPLINIGADASGVGTLDVWYKDLSYDSSKFISGIFEKQGTYAGTIVVHEDKLPE